MIIFRTCYFCISIILLVGIWVSCSGSQQGDTELFVNIEQESNEDVNVEDSAEDNEEEMNDEDIGVEIESDNENIDEDEEDDDDDEMEDVLKEVLSKEDIKVEKKPVVEKKIEVVEEKIEVVEEESVSEVELKSFHKVNINVDQDFAYSGLSKLNLMNYISFVNLGEFNSKLTFYTRRMANIEVLYQREKDLIIKFKHCVIDGRLLRPLDTSEFKSVVDFVRIEQFNLPSKNVVIRIKLNKPSIINITQKQNEIYFQSRLDPFLNIFPADG